MNGNVGVYLILLCVISAECMYGSGSKENLTLRRYRRQQTQCKADEIACSSGDCILEENECDGKADCKDGSDEANCANFRCPSNLFQCAYGACIRKNAVCDGKNDCKDSSDETTPLCKNRVTPKPSVCKNGEFQCNSLNCINEELLCDGKADCPDNSDETVKACSDFPCNPRIFFRCEYGACLSQSAKCNGIRDCFDGSDEWNCPSTGTTHKIPTITTSTTTKKPTPTPSKPPTPTKPRPPGTCLVPNHPTNGEYKVGASKAKPGDYVPMFSALVVQCKNKYKPSPPIVQGALPLCIDGSWTMKPPSCALSCDSLSSTSTTKVTCKHYGQELDNCDNPVHGTVASFQCELFHEIESSLSPNTVCKDGSWDYPSTKCLPVCGEKRPRGTPNIIGGHVAIKSSYPWHVGVFNATNDNICGGSIISQRVVLSAAHCFTDQRGKLYPVQDYKIVAGKYYRAFDDSRDEGAQESPIDNIFVPERYRATENNYEADLAVIVLTNALKPSLDVQPICVDWRNLYEHEQLFENNVGVIVGWGQTVLGGLPSTELKELKVPYKPYSDCYEQVPPEFRKFLTYDKICAGYLDQKQSVCQGDSGGGLAFQRNQNRFYIRGIVSTSPSSRETGTITCDSNQYATYTKVSTYIQLITDIETQNRV